MGARIALLSASLLLSAPSLACAMTAPEGGVDLSAAFDIPSNTADSANSDYVETVLGQVASSLSACAACKSDGLVVIVDRSAKQTIMVVSRDGANDWNLLYFGHVSTGKPGRKEHFKTPTGAFVLDGSILDYRAEGTYNENHIRGIGLKGSRVWDFGWQETEDWRTEGHTVKIRMEMHATDPANLEHRIGRADSEGCIRIHADLNKVLDRYGVLDAAPNQLAQDGSAAWRQVLGRDHVYLGEAGNTLVIVDSSHD